ncbi:MAG: cysteine desulfurase [Deltaproteobacteria bacterium CG_4_8_14_3_um_filter_45_9]|nr:MAG: cysteine desulfurase [Deltaproteobacteria bacterium CG03_land_8_20_14_0_80_45_14]PIX21791.1 MAG: cysteine desulfurase [Deltaproteobacteria bacterium CG_4_8_14_3_um_filter_45_9]
MIYFDNAATSWPKPPQVKEAMNRFMEEVGANPGRSGHVLSIEAARMIYEAREALSALFHVKDSSRIVFTLNATESINLALKGLLKYKDHVITSSMEHNSVMRPLRDLEKRGIALTVVPCFEDGTLDPREVEKQIQSTTRMIVLNHASNVTGTLLPVREIGKIAREYNLLFLVDAAQTAGAYPMEVDKDGIDLLAFSGHKSLYGPQGTGGLVIGERINEKEMIPLKQGGTGSRSEFEEQPDFLPDRLESGTPNGVGIAGLLAGVQFVLEKGVEQIRQKEITLIEKLIKGLKEIPQVKLYGPESHKDRMATLSFNFTHLSPSDGASHLEKEFGILCRPGLHCAPAAHHTIGTFPEGTIRFGLSIFNTGTDIETAIQAISQISKER